MSASTVVIVESPAKAKTINRYLGRNYSVLASFGHVRDLPSRDGSVDPDDGFSMRWEESPSAKNHIKAIAFALKDADRLVLATDPDREGEAISWHLMEVLKRKRVLKKHLTIERVSFNAITKDAVCAAMDRPRNIDAPLVDAYLARRALDYLVGFSLSPVLWRKLPGARSAGRVQSVALRLICDRETEIEAFVSIPYWSVTTEMAPSTAAGTPSSAFPARLHAVDTIPLKTLDISSLAQAEAYKRALESANYTVASLETKDVRNNPPAPFTTSSLQQEASRKLGFSSKQTMQIAQKLYEGVDFKGESTGLITYMRTDGVQIIPSAIAAIRDTIQARFGKDYLPPSARVHKAKARNAQEAHEAIRPTSFVRSPESLSSVLPRGHLALYDMIWKRTLASQMAQSTTRRVRADIDAAGTQPRLALRATGSQLVFPGYRAMYREGAGDGDAGSQPGDTLLPPLRSGQPLTLASVQIGEHATEPPARFSEASLIKALEEHGIGRPSTYTSTLSVLQDRQYIRAEKRRLFPEDKGRLVTAFLSNFFGRYVEYGFTAEMEEKLDRISNGDLPWKGVLDEFWRAFSAAIDEVKSLRVSEVLDALNEALAIRVFPPREDGGDPRSCTACDEGKLSLKVGRFGAFVGCSRYPDCGFTRPFSQSERDGEVANSAAFERDMGPHPDTGKMIRVRSGRFGPYLEMETDDKPKRANIPRPFDPATLSFERAVQLLSLPIEVGLHPETGKTLTASIGRFGPYVHCDGVYANLESPEEVFEVGLNRAVALISDKIANPSSRARAGKKLGEHPTLGGAISLRTGRYGAYVNHRRTNVSLPEDADLDNVTLESAVEMLASRKASTAGAKGKTARSSKKSSNRSRTRRRSKAAAST